MIFVLFGFKFGDGVNVYVLIFKEIFVGCMLVSSWFDVFVFVALVR